MMRANRRGTYTAIFGITCSTMIGFTALSVDVGWHRIAMTQLATAADAGAVAGALILDGTKEGIEKARLRAAEVTAMNEVHGQAVRVPMENIIVGRFDAYLENDCKLDIGCWTPLGEVPSGYGAIMSRVEESDVNAVYVGAEGTVNTFFAGLTFRRATLNAANYAIARRPIVQAQGVACAFPLAMPQCTPERWMESTPCGRLIRMRRSSANIDNMAWSTSLNRTGAKAIKEATAVIDDDCSNQYGNVLSDGVADAKLHNGNVTAVRNIINKQLKGKTQWFEGVSYNYSELIEPGWDENWGDCPDDDVEEYCDEDEQGAKKGRTWISACPDEGPDCDGRNKRFVRRTLTVFDSGGKCDFTGNPEGSINYNKDIDISGYVDMVIYNVGPKSDPYIDAYISCTDAEGNLRDIDGDGTADVVHDGTGGGPSIEPPEMQSVALVE